MICSRFVARRWFALALLFAVCAPSWGSGVFEDGASARARSLGGISVAGSTGPLDALDRNPAELANETRPALQAGGDFGWGEGEFQNRANRDSEMHTFGATPHAALSFPLGRATFGLGFLPDAAVRASWHYRDAPGGLDGGTSYGRAEHFSELLVARLAFGASYAVTPQLSFGAGLGLLYNRNVLRAPYTIQSQPNLRGAKVRLDLDTEGWGANGVFGVLWKPAPSLQAGLSYTLPSRIRAAGGAHTDARQQLARLGVTGVDTTANANGVVTNNFPQTISGALSWQPAPAWTLLGQVDWIDWRDAFDSLDVRLQDVDNALYRQLLAGHRDLDDRVPLRWKDQWSFRLGVEYAVNPHWTVRGGYRYATSVVPTTTLTPLTAAANEHLLSAGLGFHSGRYSADLAWQWELPSANQVGRSDLLSGEYSGSKVVTEAQFLSFTTRVEF